MGNKTDGWFGCLCFGVAVLVLLGSCGRQERLPTDDVAVDTVVFRDVDGISLGSVIDRVDYIKLGDTGGS